MPCLKIHMCLKDLGAFFLLFIIVVDFVVLVLIRLQDWPGGTIIDVVYVGLDEVLFDQLYICVWNLYPLNSFPPNEYQLLLPLLSKTREMGVFLTHPFSCIHTHNTYTQVVIWTAGICIVWITEWTLNWIIRQEPEPFFKQSGIFSLSTRSNISDWILTGGTV